MIRFNLSSIKDKPSKPTTNQHQTDTKQSKYKTNKEMFTFPYSYNNRGDVHDKIYGDYDIYYYSMRILCNYLSNLEKYQGISKIDLDDYDGKYNLGFNISNRIMVNKTELPNETVVYKLIKSLNKEHFLKFIKAYCIDTEISYTTNLNNIDMREFLMYACSELIGDYKDVMIEGWTGNKWEKVHNKDATIYRV